ACGLAADIGLREGDLRAGFLELGQHAPAALAVAIAERHARAFGGETPDRRLADPRRPARHRRNLAVQPCHVRHHPCLAKCAFHHTSYPSGRHSLMARTGSELNRAAEASPELERRRATRRRAADRTIRELAAHAATGVLINDGKLLRVGTTPWWAAVT